MVHHLLVEVGDAPGGFRGRNHLAGRQHRAIGLAQAQQQLVLRGVAAGDGDDRLIGQLQLAFQQRQMLLFADRLAVHVAGHAGAQQARLQGGAFDGFQGTVGIVESGRQRGIADHAAQMHGFVVADHERARRQLFTQGRGDAFQAVLIGGARQQQEAVVVQACQQVRVARLGQALAGLHHQAFEGGIPIALAQAQRAGDFDEQHATRVAVGKRGVELLQYVVACRQAGFRIAGGRRTGGAWQGRGLRTRAPDAVGHGGDQVARADRLAQVVIGATVEHFELALRVRVAAEEYDRQQLQAGLLADQRGQAHAVQPGQVQVHQDQVRAVVLDRLQRTVGIAVHDRLHAGTVQHALREQCLGAIVLDDQHAIGRIGSGRRLVVVASFCQR